MYFTLKKIPANVQHTWMWKEGYLAAKNNSCIPDRQNIQANVHEAATPGEGENAILIDVQFTLVTILSTGTPATNGLPGVAS